MDSSWVHVIGVCLSTIVSIIESVGNTLIKKSHIIYSKYEKLIEQEAGHDREQSVGRHDTHGRETERSKTGGGKRKIKKNKKNETKREREIGSERKNKKRKIKKRYSFLNISIRSLQISEHICYRKGNAKKCNHGEKKWIQGFHRGRIYKGDINCSCTDDMENSYEECSSGGEMGARGVDVDNNFMEKPLTSNFRNSDISNLESTFCSLPCNEQGQVKKITHDEAAYIRQANVTGQEFKEIKKNKEKYHINSMKNNYDTYSECKKEMLDITSPVSSYSCEGKKSAKGCNLIAREINKKSKRKEKFLCSLKRSPRPVALKLEKRASYFYLYGKRIRKWNHVYNPSSNRKSCRKNKNLLHVLNGKDSYKEKGSVCRISSSHDFRSHLPIHFTENISNKLCKRKVEEVCTQSHKNKKNMLYFRYGKKKKNKNIMNIIHKKNLKMLKSDSINGDLSNVYKMYYSSFPSDRLTDRLYSFSTGSMHHEDMYNTTSFGKNKNKGLKRIFLGKVKYSDEEEITRCSTFKIEQGNEHDNCPTLITSNSCYNSEYPTLDIKKQSYFYFYLGIILTSFLAPALNIFSNICLPTSMVGFVSIRLICSLLLEKFVLKENQPFYLYVGIPFSTAGLTIVTIFSSSSNNFKDLDSVFNLFLKTESIVLLTCEMLFSYLIVLLSLRHLRKNGAAIGSSDRSVGLSDDKLGIREQHIDRKKNRKQRSNASSFFFFFFFFFSPVFSGTMGSMATIFSKATFIGLVSVLLNDKLTLRDFFLNYKVVVLIVLTIVCSITEILYTPYLLKHYKLTHIVSLKSFGNISFNALNGMIIFDERPSCMYFWAFGFLLILIGIILLSYKNVIPKTVNFFKYRCRKRVVILHTSE
ncbi:hypothetical protein, conserved [Plasmodium gonderi]|uniref:Magnesium transporter n=1 Tax=Plasmodium gonderi TaxID=77519 RepID=A0A1Y1JLU1_PLAGO|nr:hypothetical protein, conserved [Plasmodium gonderi]GAW82415.1 hypothetical protein, conserved [Plasmodium gonderi]